MQPGPSMESRALLATRAMVAVAASLAVFVLAPRLPALDAVPPWLMVLATGAVGSMILGRWWSLLLIPATVTSYLAVWWFISGPSRIAPHHSLTFDLFVLLAVIWPCLVVGVTMGMEFRALLARRFSPAAMHAPPDRPDLDSTLRRLRRLRPVLRLATLPGLDYATAALCKVPRPALRWLF
jgi:hypothetical protein